MCDWGLCGSSVNTCWMIIECWPPGYRSFRDSFHSLSLALTSLRSCRLGLSSYTQDSYIPMNIPSASQSQHIKIDFINFPFLERQYNLEVKSMESGIFAWIAAPILNGWMTLGKSLNSCFLVWGNIRCLGFNEIMDTNHLTQYLHIVSNH